MKKKNSLKGVRTVKVIRQQRNEPSSVRTFAELIGAGGQNDDWLINNFSDDAEVWQNSWALTGRVRDLFRCDPLYQSIREQLWANIFGADGTLLRMQIKETEDRVIHTDEEKAIRAYEDRRNVVKEWLAFKEGMDYKAQTVLAITGLNGSRKASVKVGQPDIFANLLIERKWKEWQRREYCDLRGTRNYQTIRQLRLISAVRDGDFFIRMVKDPKVNKFGFTLQIINAEWVDRFYSCTLNNGNVIRMGIEYEMSSWGLGKPVAYHFIKRLPRDWMSGAYAGGRSSSYGGSGVHDRVPADQIIHYARAVDADSTRPAPWVASTIQPTRQLQQAMVSEVIAWRASACKTGWLSSDIVPEGGFIGDNPDPTKAVGIKLKPGGIYGLPYGVKHEDSNPTHPNANVEDFRKAMIRNITAGVPGANYSTVANDYEAINYSAGRLQRLDSNENYMVLQVFDTDYAEVIVFENWLEMALMTGEVPLPLSKFEKFNQKIFSGRRWQGVDPVKDYTASALAVANKFSSRTRECASRGLDFEEVLHELATEEMLIDSYGLKTETTVETPGVVSQVANEPDNADDPAKPTPPKGKKGKGRRTLALTD